MTKSTKRQYSEQSLKKTNRTGRNLQSRFKRTLTSSERKRVSEIIKLTVDGNPENFNHMSLRRRRSMIKLVEKGNNLASREYRSLPRRSTELLRGRRGQHEILATSERSRLYRNSIALGVGMSARTSTALSALRGKDGEVVAHSGLIVQGKTTIGQADAHEAFHKLPDILKSERDPIVAAALAIETAIKGLAKPQHLRTDSSLTGSTFAIGRGSFEAPNVQRGEDDGYESDTERGRFTRRYTTGIIHLKNTLYTLQEKFPQVKSRIKGRKRNNLRGGGLGRTELVALELPKIDHLSDTDKAIEITRFAFSKMQLLKE